MKKWNMLLLALALTALPAAGSAQDLPELFTQVYRSIGEGLEQGAAYALDAMGQDLTLEIGSESGRLEEGKTVRLSVTAGNPLPRETGVSISLSLPERLTAAPDTAWEAVLPAGRVDPVTGEVVPSVTTFTREIALTPGGGSENAVVSAEMQMGTRFYRAQAALALCVADVSVSAEVEGDQDRRLQPGDSFVYRVEIVNSGTAPKDVPVELTLPKGTALGSVLPAGFAQTEGTISGQVRAEADAACELAFEAVIDEDVLADDEDAQRLLSASLRADGERVAVPRVQVCGPKISARLMTDSESFDAGEETMLSIVVVNAGLAEADVRLSCMLPEGLIPVFAQEESGEATPGETQAALTGGDGDVPGPGAAVTAEMPLRMQAVNQRELVLDLRMDGAQETAEGVIARTQVIEIPVRAGDMHAETDERLLGAALSFAVEDEPAQLGEAVAMRVQRPVFMGVSAEEWSAVFWTGVLLFVVVAFVGAAMRRDKRREDYCFE